ncbi:MAG TPA: Mur ligase family protein [Acidimicrobiales bacterium]|nr:Mur ligase family protein [Acidimicrobiales bacterium]
MNVALAVILSVLLAVAYCAQMARWLRVLQREHYDPTSMMRFLARWTSPNVSSKRVRRPVTVSHVLVLAMIVLLALRLWDLFVVAVVTYGLVCPWGLAVRGRTSPLDWTRRLRSTAIVAGVITLAVAGLGALAPHPLLVAAVTVLVVPLVLDLTTRALRPYEERGAQRYVDQAVQRLDRTHPRIVAITGSYGKTSTKNYLRSLLANEYGVVASPRSFNNRAGLSRAINENLDEATRIFIAEMGTYGPGEIRELTSWCSPEIAVVTAIGSVHLERMGSLDIVEAAKREITERAGTVVLNIDDPRLASWPASLRAEGKRVITAGSTNSDAEIRVIADSGCWSINIDGATLAAVDEIVGVQPTNLACALGAAVALHVDTEHLRAGLAGVSPVANRLNVSTAASGVVVVDDTFNANPASASAALKVLSSLQLAGRRVVVTPGLIELGREQDRENAQLAHAVEVMSGELVAIGLTNARALAAGSSTTLRRFGRREDAVAWVRSTLGSGDAVLFLNDLPDHYP